MAYTVFFYATVEESLRQQIAAMLRALPVVVVESKSMPVVESDKYQRVLLVTLGSDPSAFTSLRHLSFRSWVAIVPDKQIPLSAFLFAGASAVLHLPLERSTLLSAVARSFVEGSSPLQQDSAEVAASGRCYRDGGNGKGGRRAPVLKAPARERVEPGTARLPLGVTPFVHPGVTGIRGR